MNKHLRDLGLLVALSILTGCLCGESESRRDAAATDLARLFRAERQAMRMSGHTDEEEAQLLREWVDRLQELPRLPGLAVGERDSAYDLLVELMLECESRGLNSGGLSTVVDRLRDWEDACPNSELLVERAVDCLWWCLDTEHMEGLNALLEELTRSESRQVRGPACIGLARFLKNVAESEPEKDFSKRWIEKSRELLLGLSEDGLTDTYSERAQRILHALNTVSPGFPCPEFSGRDLEGEEVRSSSLRGSVVLLVFWGYWCGACRQRIPRIETLHRKFEGRGLRVLGVNSDREEVLRESLETMPVGWRNILDKETTGPVTSLFGIDEWPSYLLIDRHGVIRVRNPRNLEAAVETLLEE